MSNETEVAIQSLGSEGKDLPDGARGLDQLSPVGACVDSSAGSAEAQIFKPGGRMIVAARDDSRAAYPERKLARIGENTTLPSAFGDGVSDLVAPCVGDAVVTRDRNMTLWLTRDGDDSGVEAHAAQIAGPGSKTPRPKHLVDLHGRVFVGGVELAASQGSRPGSALQQAYTFAVMPTGEVRCGLSFDPSYPQSGGSPERSFQS